MIGETVERLDVVTVDWILARLGRGASGCLFPRGAWERACIIEGDLGQCRAGARRRWREGQLMVGLA